MRAVRDLTEHAALRAWQRVGLRPRSADRMAGRVWQEGLHREDARGTLRRYLDQRWELHPHGSPVVYGEHVWIFGRARVLTILILPRALRDHARTQIARNRSTHKSQE